MFEPIARVLAFFYSLPVVGGSVGIAIILLTAAVMTLLMPLTLKATRSTIKMQEMQPKLKELQKKHADDKATLNQELMALYQENGINPVGGCLPMIAQLPVFLVLFNVLRGLSRRVSEAPYHAIAEQARAQLGLPPVSGNTFDPRYLSSDSDLYVDLSQRSEMTFGPFDLAQEARDVIQNNVVDGIPYVILILFVVATSFYQQRQVSSRRTGSIGMNPQQEMILKVLPLASGVWSFLFPAGLVLYWATSNVFRIGQQSYITRAFYSEKAAAERAKQGGDESVDDVEDEDSFDDDDDDDASEDSSDGGAPRKKAPNKSGSNGSSPRGKSGASKGNTKGGNKGGNKAKKSNAGGVTPKKPKTASEAEADDDQLVDRTNGDSAPTGSAADRAEAWAKRRERAKAQAGTKNRADQTSRVTPKGTKPSAGPKKKRKR